MINNLVRSIIACSFLFVSANAYAWDVSGYKGPTMDLSKYQPEMRLGFLGDESAQDIIKNNACLKEYAEVAYGVPAKIYTFKDYAGTMESMLGGSLDYAWFGSSGYAGIYLEDPTATVPILTRMQPTGDMGYYSVMVTRSDSGINSLDDLKGKSFGWADPNSTSGYLIPSIELKAAGMDPDSYFGSTQFSGGHENNVLAVLNGDIDAGVTWVSGVGEWSEGYSSGNLRKMVDKGLLNMDDIKQIWSSALIPNGPIVMPTNMPVRAHQVMVGMKQWIHENDPQCSENVANGVVKAWVPVDHSFYETIVAARKAKIEAKKAE
jgi:phosphonate transport system substrate-binding protein